MCSRTNDRTLDLRRSSSYLGLSSLVLLIFLFPFSHNESARNSYFLNCEDGSANPVGQVLSLISDDPCRNQNEAEHEGFDGQPTSEQEEITPIENMEESHWTKPSSSWHEEGLTKEIEHCFEQDTHFDRIFEEWVRIEHHDGSYTYEYRYRYEYNYNYQYWYNLDKCVGPLPESFSPNEPPVPLPFPHDGNAYPGATP